MVRPRLSASRSARGRPAAPLLLGLTAACALGCPHSVHAHGFGQRYELPLPLSLYLYGAAAVVALSFLVFGLFLHGAPASRTRPQIDLRAGGLARILGQPAVTLALRLAGLALFVVVLLAGLLGDQNPYRNIAPTFVWIIWWVGFAYIAAFVGDVWWLINPWRTVFDGLQWLYRRFGGRGALGAGLTYPPALGAWPACILLLAFSWTELVYPNAASPIHIAALAIAYSALTWAGMLLFGRDVWLQNGEVFSLVFGTFARFAPTESRNGQLLLRPFGAGLLDPMPVSPSQMAFVLLLLASVLYDGLIGTGEWAAFEGALRERWPGLGDLAVRSIGLPAFWLLFAGAYLGICAVMSWVASGRPAPLEVARSFALTLIPIAIGYHVAHYLVFLLIQGQYIIPLLSDPLGRGWNLFGTAGYRVDIAVAGARFAWYTALGAIVSGHVLAVYLGHVRAMAVFAPTHVALGTQVALTALMVVYTFVGLSITAEPITESRLAAEPAVGASADAVSIPADAVLPEAPSGRLQSVGPGKSATLKLAYKVLGSAFHDGTKTSPADLLYAYAFAYRWGVQGSAETVRYDPYVDAATAPLRQALLGVRIVGIDAASKSFRVGDVNFVREVIAVEVYLTGVAEGPEWSAVIAPPWSTLPWHLLALLEAAVERGWAAFSEQEARRRGLPWLDLVRDKELGAKLAALATEFERGAWTPDVLRGLVGADDARRRWAALLAFHRANGHVLVTNGPYRLKAWSEDSVMLEAFRDLTYPLGVGSYDAYAYPRRGFLTGAEWSGGSLLLSGDIEIVEKFQRSHRLVRTPLKSVPPADLRRAAPECRYLVTDADGRVVLAGVATLGADAHFHIDLPDRLPAGRYILSALMAVNGNVMNPDIRRIEIALPLQR
jgi:hypothetical protein